MTFASSLERYFDLAGDVSNASYELLADRLKQWFRHLDSDVYLGPIVSSIEAGFDFDKWKETGLVEQPGTGSGRIRLPDENTERLAALLGIFRMLSEEEDAGWRFASEYVSIERRFDDMVYDLLRKFFDPLERDLAFALKSRFEKDPSAVETDVKRPKPERDKLSSAIQSLHEALRSSNSPLDEDDRQQRLSELSAAMELLKAPKQNVKAIWNTGYSAARWVDSAMENEEAGKRASPVWNGILEYLGFKTSDRSDQVTSDAQ